MNNFQMLLQGFSTSLTPTNILCCMLGAVLGLFVGAMPGIGSLAGCVLLLPLTYKFSPATAIIMLGALYYANMYGGSFSAILLNIPGDSPAVVTTLDGYPMATRRKRPGQALLTANMSSFIGGTIGITILTFTGTALANVGMKFGPSEMTALLLIAMTSITWLVGENPTKGIIASCIGILVASIGIDTQSGVARYYFGNRYLLGGVSFSSFAMGAVGFAQVISMVNDKAEKPGDKKDFKLSIRGSLLTKHDFKRLLPPAIRSGLLGTFIGILPGAGATTGSFMGYAVQKKFKSEEELGTGAIEGIAAGEAANNAAAAGAFAPLLALGIPGSATGAVLLGGLMMWGLNPGPLLFEKQPEFCWGLISSLYLANIFTLIVAVAIIPLLVKILSVPIKYMIPIVSVVCVVGAYSTSYSMYGVIVMFLSGLLGYVMNKYDFPVAPMLLAYVLAPIMEGNMRKTFIISNGSLSIFFTKPITCVLTVIFLGILVVTLFRPLVVRFRKAHVGKKGKM